MHAYDIIAKKRDGQELTSQEIKFLIQGYAQGLIPDYQISAWAMAVFFQGLNDQETANLTKSIINSGETIDLSPIAGIKVDKHSTGGVGDTTTLILGPIVAAGGVPFAKMSGRGLGHTGGTIDKLEAIPGFQVELTKKQFIEQVNKIKLAVIGQSGNLVPADKKLYALRDVTATINSIPLIASSVMSKKIAAGADAILLDVKTGSGAFIKDVQQAKELAKVMVNIGKSFNRKTIAVISNMNQPLGEAVGNSLEVQEAILTLKGEGPSDLTKLCEVLAGYMFVLGGKTTSYSEGKKLAQEIISSGQGLNKFKQFIKAQSGNEDITHNSKLLPRTKNKLLVTSPQSGYIEKIHTQVIGQAAMILGAGRETKEDLIDHAVGILIKKKIGDKVSENEILAEIFYNEQNKAKETEKLILNAYQISANPVEKPELILEVIE